MTNRGIRAERELVKMFYDAGFGVIRTPASGAGTDRPLPDIVASNGGDKIFAIECKSSKRDFIQLTIADLKNLVDFSERFGATPLFAFKFFKKGWTFLRPSDMLGRLKVEKGFALLFGKTFEEII